MHRQMKSKSYFFQAESISFSSQSTLTFFGLHLYIYLLKTKKNKINKNKMLGVVSTVVLCCAALPVVCGVVVQFEFGGHQPNSRYT